MTLFQGISLLLAKLVVLLFTVQIQPIQIILQSIPTLQQINTHLQLVVISYICHCPG